MRSGMVYLVGAGPGDPELLTLKAYRLLQSADVVLYDRLVHPDVLKLCAPQARLINVGKGSHGEGMTQEEISARLVAEAQNGLDVVRLKGGDPFIFGRGGEEALALDAANIPWEVVPGLSSALAAATASEIPLTHRGVSAGVCVVTAHREAGWVPDWSETAKFAGTLVILMGMGRLQEISAGLIAAGKDPSTPAAVVHRATWPNQEIVHAPLAAIAEACRKRNLGAPAVIIVGEVTEVLRRAVPPLDPVLFDLSTT